MNEKDKHTAQLLLRWYDSHKRELPWRQNTSPYGIWISEIMAQQTRISALLPYYARFMEKFPTVRALAEAEQDEVIKAWEGLGYYSRAVNLRKAAQQVMTDFGGNLPDDEKELLKLPGIGKYTAGAILSIAFEKPYPAVDGNVLRVFSRLQNSRLDIAAEAAKQAATEFVRAAMPETRVGCFTQALMELGALVCLPQNPLCAECPLQPLCEAYEQGVQSELPVKSAKNPQKQQKLTVLLVCDKKGRVLMRQRTQKLLHGLFEYCLLEEGTNEEDYLNSLGLTLKKKTPIGKAKHVFTHIIWQMDGYCCEVEGETDKYTFFDKQAVRSLAVPTALRYFTNWYLEKLQKPQKD